MEYFTIEQNEISKLGTMSDRYDVWCKWQSIRYTLYYWSDTQLLRRCRWPN